VANYRSIWEARLDRFGDAVKKKQAPAQPSKRSRRDDL
jgi:hypothetical protein